MEELNPFKIVLMICAQCVLIYIQALIMPSAIITGIHIAVVVIGFASGILAHFWKSPLLRLVFIWSSLAAMLFFASLRAWMILFDNSLLVAFLLIVVIVLAGAVHYLDKDLSQFLYREQMYPQTKAGKLFRRYVIWVIIIWTIIARSGVIIYGYRDMELLPRFLWYMAVLGYFGAVALTFFAVYQCLFLEPAGSIWKKWSWGRSKKKNENEEV